MVSKQSPNFPFGLCYLSWVSEAPTDLKVPNWYFKPFKIKILEAG
jgi:hypothetical protein